MGDNIILTGMFILFTFFITLLVYELTEELPAAIIFGVIVASLITFWVSQGLVQHTYKYTIGDDDSTLIEQIAEPNAIDGVLIHSSDSEVIKGCIN